MTIFAIEITGLTHSFGAVKALNNVSLKIPKRGVFGFLGVNGAGKTTTISCNYGLPKD